MNPLFRGPRVALALTLVPIGASTASAAEGDFLVQTLGDTTVEVLDARSFGAYSATRKPAVAFDGPIDGVRLAPADASDPSPSSLALSVAVLEGGAPLGDFTLTFDAQAAAPKYFDGRLLTARDTADEQGYRPRAAMPGGESFSFYLAYQGSIVAVVPAVDGVAPFVIDGVPDAFDAEPVAAAGGSQHIELYSFHFNGTNVGMDSGERFTVDTVIVQSPHEVGHSLSLHHVGASTVRAVGVDTLVLDVESEGALEAIEQRVVDQAAFEVRGNVAVELSAHDSLSAVTARFMPVGGALQRVRVRRRGAAYPQSNPPWGIDRIDHRLDVPPPGEENVYEFLLERRHANGTTIASSGYIRVKKLNSG